ncbi:MAG TPA: orotate phosphoribosyltransferase [Candidatus Avimonas sp.]|jgi:orotate phosphoribosyltransferase|nr:orotate phosphoribosyltransferase [Clostridiales bacterium]HOB37174.1 orotate phosphoribosyltransferase [Candidatus Avimonas sp.]HQA16581.1 orotate phosphoribosyltransferase [Candidatus Avimonas sp.]HQD38624.1 orotate phosphoribosyltransferase [Candidatus Avimonas sp.]
MAYKQEFIEFMVKSGALTFGDFITKSGRKTPYFINTGNYRTGAQAAKLGEFYADCIMENIAGRIDALFGPAYKGIPLSVACSIALFNKYGRDVGYCFNRKEAKDHGEGGSMVGYKLKDGDRILIIEDVITAGTAVRECIPVLKSAADIEIAGLVISVDRMERGSGGLSAIEEIKREFGIKTYPIVTVREIIGCLHNRQIDGRVYVDDAVRRRMEEYLKTYGA